MPEAIGADWRVSDQARRLQRYALVWDAHSCVPLKPEFGLAMLSQHRRAGVDYVSINVGYDPIPWPHSLRVLAGFRAWVLQHPEEFQLVETIADVHAAKRDGRLGVSFDLEGALAFDGDLDMIALYHRLGVRQAHLAYNRNNPVAGGCHDEDIPLTAFGRRVVGEINRLGILMDCS